MARPEAFKEFLKDNDFNEEVEGKFIKYFNDIHEDVYLGDPLDNCSVWYEEFDDFYWLGKQISYEQFRRNLDQYNEFRKNLSYSVKENDLLYFIGCVDADIRNMSIEKYFVPEVLLDNRLAIWKKYNEMLKEFGGDYFEEELYLQLKELVDLKKRSWRVTVGEDVE